MLEQERDSIDSGTSTAWLQIFENVDPAESAYYFREIYPGDVEFLLCEPEPVFTFDLANLTLEQIPKRFSVRKPIVRRGQANGICIYFKAIFDDDISISTGPDSAKTHWPMLLYRTPARIHLPANTPIRSNSDLSGRRGWSWQIGPQEGAG